MNAHMIYCFVNLRLTVERGHEQLKTSVSNKVFFHLNCWNFFESWVFFFLIVTASIVDKIDSSWVCNTSFVWVGNYLDMRVLQNSCFYGANSIKS